MRNMINLKKSLVVAASLAALIAGGVPVAQAAAVVTRDIEGCGMLDGNGGFVFATDAKMTATQSPNGNATFQCKANVTPAKSGDAVQWDFTSAGLLFNSPGEPCGVPVADPATGLPYTLTQHWEETVSASGNATFTCHLP